MHKGIVYKCTEPDCEYALANEGALRKHVRKVHEKIRDSKCETCGRLFYSDKDMRSHYKIRHVTEKNFACDQCVSRFVTNGKLLKHIKVVHLKERKHRCDICKKAFSVKDSLNQHMKIHNGEERIHTIPCEVCGLKIKNRLSLVNDHIHHEHPSQDDLNSIIAKCNSCDKEFSESVTLNDHKDSCGSKDEKKFPCTLCQDDLVWNSSNALKKHIAEEHKVLRCICDLCGKILQTLHQSYAHQKKSHGMKGGKDSWKEWVEKSGYKINLSNSVEF